MTFKPKILVVDDEASILAVLYSLLVKQGYEVKTAESGKMAIDLIEHEKFNLLLTDIRMSAMDGIDLLKQARKLQEDLVAVLMTAYATVETAKLAMMCGAYDYICKPFKLDELRDVVRRALAVQPEPAPAEEMKRLPDEALTYHFDTLVGESAAMQTLYNSIDRISATESPVLLCGKYGTGKTLIAQTLHYNSRKGEHPFVALDCAKTSAAELRRKLFADDETAETLSDFMRNIQGGTLYLAEVHSLSLFLQDCLAELLANSRLGFKNADKADIRIIAGSSAEDFEKLLAAGSFSDKLHRHLATLIIKIPDLQERRGDLPLLIQHFLKLFCTEDSHLPGISHNAWQLLQQHGWEQNIAELHAVIKHAVNECSNGTIHLDDLPQQLRQQQGRAVTLAPSSAFETDKGVALQKFLKEKERATIQLVVSKCNGDRARAAQLLGLSLTMLNRKCHDESSGMTAPAWESVGL